MTQRKSYVIGVGMTKFEKPRGRADYPEIGLEAATKALLDAGVCYDEIEEAFVGYCYGDTTCGQRVLYQLGMTGIPITNVNNACSTGSTALYHAGKAVRWGAAECTLALGFDIMAPGSLGSAFTKSTAPLDKTVIVVNEGLGGQGPFAAQIFGNGGEEYIRNTGATWEHIAATAKNHKHSANNPYSQFRNEMTTEEVMKDMPISNLLTRAMCCPTSNGGAACVIASEAFVKKHGLENQAIEILSHEVVTDNPMLYEKKSAVELTGSNMSRQAAQQAFKAAKLTPDDIKVIELHDCFAPNELLVYDALGLCKPGEAAKIVDAKDNTYGGKWCINPSGGLLSKGHPLGATGLGMIFYLVAQLRGIAGPLQVDGVKPENNKGKPAYCLAHNLGLGGSCSVAILGRPDFYKSGGADGRSRVGYEFGYECKGITKECVEKVRSRKAFSEFANKPEPMPSQGPVNRQAVSKL